ncbi:MAG: regulatory protein RecX [Candidatus Dormibacteria bacterium]
MRADAPRPKPGSGGGRRPHRAPAERPDPEDRNAAEATALRILRAADQSRDGLRRRLCRHGFSAETAIEVTGKLVEGGWIDDQALAASVGAARRTHGYGRRRVAADLAARGITDDAVIAAALGDDGEAELQAARDAAMRLRRRFPSGRLGESELRRLAAALQRRGFNHDVIRSILRESDLADQLADLEDD